MKRTKDLKDNRYGKLLVLSHAGKDSNRGALWNCKCDCGNTLIVKSVNLVNNVKDNCGCNRKKKPITIDTKSTTYYSYSHMKDRCLNKNADGFDNYGGRGISICQRWLEKDGKGFLNFVSDLGERPENLTLDRINVDGNYEPPNCRWSDWETQSRNKRKHKANKSGVTGIHWNTERNKWHVQFRAKFKTFYLGLYDNLEEAKEMRKFVEKLYKDGKLVAETSLTEIRNRLWS